MTLHLGLGERRIVVSLCHHIVEWLDGFQSQQIKNSSMIEHRYIRGIAALNGCFHLSQGLWVGTREDGTNVDTGGWTG